MSKGRRRRALLLVAAHVQVRVVRPPVGQPVDQPRVAVEGEDDRLVLGEQGVEVPVGEAVRVLARRLQLHQVHDVDDADLQLRQVLCADSSTAASVSRVGTSPQQAITTSGSPPLSLLAHSQMPRPAVQCLIAWSMVSHWGAGCLPATTTLT